MISRFLVFDAVFPFGVGIRGPPETDRLKCGGIGPAERMGSLLRISEARGRI